MTRAKYATRISVIVFSSWTRQRETDTDPVPAKSRHAFAVVRNDTLHGFAMDRAVASSVIRNGFATRIPLRTSTKALRAPMLASVSSGIQGSLRPCHEVCQAL